jgi:hypothetical protein
MARYAVVRDGVVENLIVWDGNPGWQPAEGSFVVLIPDDSQVAIGDTYDGEEFGPPA